MSVPLHVHMNVVVVVVVVVVNDKLLLVFSAFNYLLSS